MVATLKGINILNTNLLSSLFKVSIYVHVLVRFVITFSRSATYQLHDLLLDCRWPYSCEKFILDPFTGKKKRNQGLQKCCKCWACWGGFFLLDFDFQTWFQVLVSFCNEKLKGINLLAPCHLISILCHLAPG